MEKHYLLKFTLEDGVHVEVDKNGADSYDFILRSENGFERHFTFVDDGPKDKLMDSLDFD